MQQYTKEINEKILCDCLILVQGKCSNLIFVKHGNPNLNEPDCFYTNRNKIIGIEVVEIFVNNVDAKNLKVLQRGFKMSNSNSYVNPTDQLIRSIYHQLTIKISKSYNYRNYDELWLNARIQAPIHTARELEDILNSFYVFNVGKFDHVYFTFWRDALIEGGGTALYELVPTN